MLCRFLYYKDSSDYRYYEAQLCQAEAGKKGQAGPIPPAAPYPGKKSPSLQRLHAFRNISICKDPDTLYYTVIADQSAASEGMS